MVRSLPRSWRSSTHDVDVAILVQVVCLAALGVGVCQVQPSAHVYVGDLCRVWEAVVRKIKSRPPDSLAARAMHLDTMRPVSESTVLIIPNLHALMKVDRSSTFSWREGSCLFFSVYLPGVKGGLVYAGTSILTGLRSWTRCLHWRTTCCWRVSSFAGG